MAVAIWQGREGMVVVVVVVKVTVYGADEVL
jgi:hypothetical protein